MNSTPAKTNMTMEHPPFEDVFPIEHGDFPASHLSFQGCNIWESEDCQNDQSFDASEISEVGKNMIIFVHL